MHPHSITVSVPSTSANIGPGFDSFGLALQLANQITLKKETAPIKLSSMMKGASEFFFSTTTIAPFPFSVTITGEVPAARGLGSSVTVRLGILFALNELMGRPLTVTDLYHLSATLEGHADNTASALLGGFTIVRKDQEPLRYELSSELHFVLLIPDFEVSTASARKLLPTSISIVDAAANAADAAVIAAAFATGKYHLLRNAFHDRLHQPFREPLVPFLPEALLAAESVGALGGWLSGSGSTIAVITESEAIAQRVVSAFQEIAPLESNILITRADNQGAKVVS